MISMNQILFDRFIKKVSKQKDFESVLEYIENHQNISSDQFNLLFELICTSKEAYYLLEFSLVAKAYMTENHFIRIINELSKTSSSNYISAFIFTFPKLQSLIEPLIERLCGLCATDELFRILKEYKPLSKDLRKIVLQTVITSSSIEDIKCLVTQYDLSKEEKRQIAHRICVSKNPYNICLFSVLFKGEFLDAFVEAISNTKNAEMLYCFIAYNPILKEEALEKVCEALYKTNNIEYIYKCLLLIKDKNIFIKYKMLHKIKQENQIKYCMLAALYLDYEFMKETYHSYQNLYDEMVSSEQFTNDELINFYKDIRTISLNSPKQLIK